MKLHGLTIEASEMAPPGAWCLWAGNRLIGIVGKSRRDFLAKFGLQIELPIETTKIVVDLAEYDRICVLLSSEAVDHG